MTKYLIQDSETKKFLENTSGIYLNWTDNFFDALWLDEKECAEEYVSDLGGDGFIVRQLSVEAVFKD